MTQQQLPIEVDEDVFKVVDSRVSRLKSGQLSTQAFALLLKPGDPFVILGHTIYVLSEQEYHTLQTVQPAAGISDSDFRKIIGMEHKEFMTDKDRKYLELVASDSSKCPSCRYNKYKDEVYKIAKKYNLPTNSSASEAHIYDYPETTGKITPKVLEMIAHKYGGAPIERKSCLDCVEKHLAQAWVLGNESCNGYPEHVTYVIGHLGEALDECPKELAWLHDTLEFFLARTKYTRKPFVPLPLVAPLLDMARQAGDSRAAHDNADNDAGAGVFELDLTDSVKQELKALPVESLRGLLQDCRLVASFIPEVEKYFDDTCRLSWEGAMASAADGVAQYAPQTANMLRNRRLLFAVNPLLAKSSGYDMSDLTEYLEGLVS